MPQWEDPFPALKPIPLQQHKINEKREYLAYGLIRNEFKERNYPLEQIAPLLYKYLLYNVSDIFHVATNMTVKENYKPWFPSKTTAKFYTVFEIKDGI